MFLVYFPWLHIKHEQLQVQNIEISNFAHPMFGREKETLRFIIGHVSGLVPIPRGTCGVCWHGGLLFVVPLEPQTSSKQRTVVAVRREEGSYSVAFLAQDLHIPCCTGFAREA